MTTPAWLAATSGQRPQAGQVNQFLGTHACQYVYTGTVQNQQATAGSGTVATNGLYIAQSFTTAAAYNATRIVLTLAKTGTPTPATVSIQSNSGAAPSGTVFASTLVPAEYAGAAVSIPLPAGLAASTLYWIVVGAVGDAGDYFAWSRSNQTSGAATSANGTSWTAQAYGLLYQVYAGISGPLVHTYDDAGARWCMLGFNANGQPTSIQEFTQGQTAAGYLYSSRALAYSGVTLTSVA